MPGLGLGAGDWGPGTLHNGLASSLIPNPQPHVFEFNKLVVGLGNPGEEYELTAHNLGFLVVDRFAERNGLRSNARDCMALVGQGRVAGKKVMLAKPQTFMNAERRVGAGVVGEE